MDAINSISIEVVPLPRPQYYRSDLSLSFLETRLYCSGCVLGIFILVATYFFWSLLYWICVLSLPNYTINYSALT